MAPGQAPVLVHVVFISFRAEATPEQRDQVLADFQDLGERCGGRNAGILFWQVDRNRDQRKNWHLVELVVFRDDTALQRFRAHPAHVRMTSMLREIADWAVGDISSAISIA
jgi:quinol monooxygenase YgiN